MSTPLSPAYSFRQATLQNHAQSHQTPRSSSSRKILPISLTPSIVNTKKPRETQIDLETSRTKEDLRLLTYYINSVIEKTLGTPLKKAKTELQGSQAIKGWQAAHASLTPKTQDDFTIQLIKKIEEEGISPTKSQPFLEKRIQLTSPERKFLEEHHEDPDFVKKFVLSRLPNGGQHSVLAGTRYYFVNNSTFENPDESNQFDSHLEAKIAPLLKVLQSLRLESQAILNTSIYIHIKIPQTLIDSNQIIVIKIDDESDALTLKGELSAEDSLSWVAAWMVNYYTQSIEEIYILLEHVEIAHKAFEDMRAFEKNHCDASKPEENQFKKYLQDVNQFLNACDVITEKKQACPSYHAIKQIRNDFQFLKKLQKMEIEKKLPLDQILRYFMSQLAHLAKPMVFDKQKLIDKYTLYLDEAEAQKERAQIFKDPCVLSQLSKHLFGVVENSQRRTPTPGELKQQIFQLFKTATPEKTTKKQRKRKDPVSPTISNVNSPQKDQTTNVEKVESKERKLTNRTLFD